MSEGEKHGDIKFLLGFFIGGLIGAATIVLLGTKEGKKAKQALEEKGQDFLDDLQVHLGDLEKRGRELVDEGEQLKEHVVATMEEEKEKITDSTVEKLDTALAHIEELQEHGRETTASLRKRLFKNIPKKR